MREFFGFDGPVMRFLNRSADIIVLSVMWLLGCLPILTIGTSTTALYYASIKSVLKEGSAAKNFLRSYKENLKQSILVELILVVVIYAMYLNWQLVFQMTGTLGMGMQILYAALLFWILSMLSYIFPILSRFVLTIGQLFKNALLMSMSHLPYTLVILVTNLLPLLLLIVRMDYFLLALPLIAFVVPGLLAYLNSVLFVKIFQKHMPEKNYVDEELDYFAED